MEDFVKRMLDEFKELDERVMKLGVFLNGEIYKAVQGDMNAYNFFYKLILYNIKIAVYVGCYFLIARLYVKYSKYIIGKVYIIILGILVYSIVNVANVYVAQHIWNGDLRRIISATLIVFCIMFDVLCVMLIFLED